MAVVVDSNLLIVMASGDPRRAAVRERIRVWVRVGEELHAPDLLPYEVANGFTRLAAAGALPPDRLDAAWRTVMALPATYHALDEGAEAVRIALRLGRQSAYDAAYLALAARLGAELWTLDGPLYRNAVGLGYPVNLAT